MNDRTVVYVVEDSVHLRAEISHNLSSLGIRSVVFNDVEELPAKIDRAVVFMIRHESACRAQIDKYRTERAPVSAKVEFSCNAGFEKAVAAIREGASDFVVWPSEPSLLDRAIHRAEDDLRRNQPAKVMGGRAKERVAMLTSRERQVLNDVINGCTTERIAAKLAISPRTVDIHRRNVLSKLNVRNTAQAIVIALSSGEFQPANAEFAMSPAYA
ncbi:LuxR C-terminal-related transcriptional regulator [Novosphingobium sp. NDB2Meth1]|uniref:LuxR C-terminal-related transcriptional regulator n=1 Tax=Novosphingobium sp. NDB2Meth1 TaxID=1892847 RepID=UPI0009317C62|nr:LuxR C-terminal-related transcriptional regulator [Novosphingobium sp. NDB2Meth1]